MSYYSTQNGSSVGNFSISNTYRPNLIQYVSNYTSGINNAGLVPSNATVRPISNVIISLAQPVYSSASNPANNTNNLADNGNVNALNNAGVSNYPVNSEELIVNDPNINKYP